MEVYNTLSITILILSFFSQFNKSEKVSIICIHKKDMDLQWFFSILLMIALTIISGIRSAAVGADTLNYVVRFENLGKCPWKDIIALSDVYSFEYGFSIFCKIIYLIFRDYRAFLFITSLWVGILFSIILKKYSKYPLFSILVFYCWGLWGSSMNIVRQMMATPILYIALDYAKKKKFWKYIFLIAFSSLIHTVSVAFIPMYFLVDKKVNIKFVIITVVTSFFIALEGARLIPGGIGWTSYCGYLNVADSTSGGNTLVVLILLVFVCSIFYKQLQDIDENINIWIIMLMIAIVSTSAGLNFGIFERVTRVFIISLIFVFPDLYFVAKKMKGGIIAFTILGLLLMYYFYHVIMITPVASSRIIPYETWIDF